MVAKLWLRHESWEKFSSENNCYPYLSDDQNIFYIKAFVKLLKKVNNEMNDNDLKNLITLSMLILNAQNFNSSLDTIHGFCEAKNIDLLFEHGYYATCDKTLWKSELLVASLHHFDKVLSKYKLNGLNIYLSHDYGGNISERFSYTCNEAKEICFVLDKMREFIDKKSDYFQCFNDTHVIFSHSVTYFADVEII